MAKERAFLDLAIASLPGTFCLFDRDGKLLRWNSNLETISGYSSEEIAEMNPLDFFVEEYKPAVREAIQRVLKESACDIDAEMLSKTGTRRHYFFNTRRILVDGKPCVICAGMDMTAHKLAEMKIHEQANLLELARDVAHPAGLAVQHLGLVGRRLGIHRQHRQRRVGEVSGHRPDVPADLDDVLAIANEMRGQHLPDGGPRS